MRDVESLAGTFATADSLAVHGRGVDRRLRSAHDGERARAETFDQAMGAYA